MPADSFGVAWLDSSAHRDWLRLETDRLLRGYERAAVDGSGGFHWLGEDGRPLADRPKYLWLNARMVHCFALAELLGRPGAGPVIEHGLAYLAGPLHDERDGGWYWSVGPGDALDADKHAYGHAFVVLAASSALQAGHNCEALLRDALGVLDRRFWEPAHGLYAERFSRDWSTPEPYRGANSQMHLTEALLAAGDAFGDPSLHERAARVAERVIRDFTAKTGWRVPEHFDERWNPLPDYHRETPDDPFRPYGSTIGHWLEWARLLVQLSYATGESWPVDAAVTLFDNAVAEGWDARAAALDFTVDWSGVPVTRDRYHWPVAEGIGAAVALYRVTRDRRFDAWYRRFWDCAHRLFIDDEQGGWRHQLDPKGRVISTVWQGKPDLYHALQATLFARLPVRLGLAAALRQGLVDG